MSGRTNTRRLGELSAALVFVYICGYLALRASGVATIFSYGTGDRELWSNIDRIPHVGPVLQSMYLPLIRMECSWRNLEWSP